MADTPTPDLHQKAWENTRRLIEAEDSVINQRLTWRLLINGFLLAPVPGVALVLDQVLHKEHHRGDRRGGDRGGRRGAAVTPE